MKVLMIMISNIFVVYQPIGIKKTPQTIQPQLYEQTVTSTTTTTRNKATNSLADEITTTKLEKSPLRRVNLVNGPQSAYARLFPDKYRQEQDEFSRRQRSRSSDNQRYNFDRITTTDNDADRRRVSFYNYNTKSTEDISRIPLHHDPNPEIIYRDNPEQVVYVQKVGVRYLKPPTPPPPEPIIIRERQATPPQEQPPLIISTTPPVPPRTPSPIIVREQPPTPPLYQPAKIITKTLPPPAAPARRVIIKRMPPLPPKPRPVIIEKWLPYKSPPERPVVYERAEQVEPIRATQRNVILQYESPKVRIEQQIQNVGYFRVDPEIYRSQFGSQLRRTDSIRRVLQDIGCNPDIITQTGSNTSYLSSPALNQIQQSSQYNSSPTNRTCFTDEQLGELMNPPVYYKTVQSNS